MELKFWKNKRIKKAKKERFDGLWKYESFWSRETCKISVFDSWLDIMVGQLNNSFQDVRHVAENVSIIFPKNILAATDKELHDGAKSSINKYEKNI